MKAEIDDLTDLIEGEREIDWQWVKPQIPLMTTEELIELMIDLGLYVNQTLALEIAKRKDAVFWLKKLIQDGRNWYQGIRGDAWPPLHAIHILPLIQTGEALELLLDVEDTPEIKEGVRKHDKLLEKHLLEREEDFIDVATEIEIALETGATRIVRELDVENEDLIGSCFQG